MKIFTQLRRKCKQTKTAKGASPSVDDFEEKKDLADALSGKKCRKIPNRAENDDHSVSTHIDFSEEESIINWKLPIIDEATTEPQTMEEELKRLQVLQSYFVLDSNAEEKFDCVTKLATMTFGTPMALISLVDLGRQWFLSETGVGLRETPREFSFCAHVVQSKTNLLVVPDLSRDFRFKNNPFVAGGPKARFYAGAALISPEGYKLGSMCVISPKARPEGLSSKEVAMLKNMSVIAVNAMVARRDRLLKEQYEMKIAEVGEAYHDMATSLNLIEAEVKEAMVPSALDTTLETLEIQKRTASAHATSLLVQDVPVVNTSDKKADEDKTLSELSYLLTGLQDEKMVDIVQVYQNLKEFISKLPRKVPIHVDIDEQIPIKIVGDDLLCFRSAICLLTHAQGRAKSDPIRFAITMVRDFVSFECQDDGIMPDSEEIMKKAYRKKDSPMGAARSMVQSMGGKCGVSKGRLDRCEGAPQSIYWFRIPIEITSQEMMSGDVATTLEMQTATFEASDQ